MIMNRFQLVAYLVAVASSTVQGFVIPQNSRSPAFRHHHITTTKAVVASEDLPITTSYQPYKVIKEKDDNINNDTNNEVVEFPPPLNKIDRFKRAATFWATSLPIMMDYYRLMTRIKMEETLSSEPLSESYIEELWHIQHQDGAKKMKHTINELKGFYVKAAQIVAARADLFPQEYTSILMAFQENVDPMSTSLAKAVIEKELLQETGQKFEDVFAIFDEQPLGAASVAQVHRAVLTEQYGKKEVAIKIQRPSIETKLMGDIKNLLFIAKILRNNPNLPLDYYVVFSELEKQLATEFDFIHEAQSMERIYNSLITAPDGTIRDIPLIMPLPVKGLVTKRVLVMDYLEGIPLTRATEAMKKRGIKPDSPEAKLFANQLLTALTTVFGQNILESGFFHADPHPGNIFVLQDGKIGLIDFGQVKEISNEYRETLNQMMIALDDRRNHQQQASSGSSGDQVTENQDNKRIGELALKLGIEIKDSAPDVAAAAMGIFLFDGKSDLPGGYDKSELSDNSPIKALKTFPQDLVLVARSSMLIKGFANRMGVPWSLAQEWAPVSRQLMMKDSDKDIVVPKAGLVRRKWKSVKKYAKSKITVVLKKLPAPIRRRAASLALRLQ